MRKLARRAGISHTWVNRIVNEEATPSADFCVAISKPLHMDPAELMRMAGILGAKPGDSNNLTLREIWDILQDMDHAQLKEARRYLLYLARNDRTPAPETVTR